MLKTLKQFPVKSHPQLPQECNAGCVFDLKKKHMCRVVPLSQPNKHPKRLGRSHRALGSSWSTFLRFLEACRVEEEGGMAARAGGTAGDTKDDTAVTALHKSWPWRSWGTDSEQSCILSQRSACVGTCCGKIFDTFCDSLPFHLWLAVAAWAERPDIRRLKPWLVPSTVRVKVSLSKTINC